MKHFGKRMKGILVLMLGALLVLGGCANSGSSSSSNANKKLTIGFVTINQEAYFFTESIRGAQEQAKKMGAKLVVADPNNDTVKQNNDIENLVNQKVDAIIVDSIDTKGVIPAMKEAAKAHIPVISIDAVVKSSAVSTQIGVDNAVSSQELGNYVNKYVKANMKQPVKMGVVGALNSFIQVIRQNAFLDTVKKTPSLKVVNIVDGKNVQQTAMTSAENLMTGHPEMNVAFATGEPALVGLASAVKSQHKEKKLTVFGWDLSKQAIQGIDEGWVKAVVQQHPEKFGSEGVKAAVQLAQKKKVAKTINVPVTIVTKDNVDQFKHLFK
ncbi:substrate-binding domain-containing protein [Sporolactobacillus spathodeae]|uniref:Ribose transport system substrate-binding protein n=1 Tax=Sporolactobacillus spathodeae TaxID=1465502 RepID=A0ABS2Q7G9_9BACL|nr:substrate-binding domain-containing protein [Sporolactobacillus spathodeae]MBM7657737.1 ribose transport system substrate-binding protein [Sporolactobacillus spathodeae]